jgi:hypothetical protein
MIWCSQYVHYTSTRNLLCHNMFYDHTLSEIWTLPDIYNYRLTRARRIVECAFGTVCNKWRIFHCAIGVCPDFCNVTVKTYCILHNFVRQGDCFQFQDTLYKCPLESIKAVGKEVILQGWRAQGMGMSLHWGAWQGASLPGTYV